MWIKLGVAAAVATYATVSLASVDYRNLYNEMYPANGLKRDVLGLCQASKPTFVRAMEQDRVGCYDSMPNAIERAIGWVRTSARLAALRTPTGVELAEKLMQQAESRQRVGPGGVLQFTADPIVVNIASPCEPPVATAAATRELSTAASGASLANAPLASDQLAKWIAGGDPKLLAELGLAKAANPDAKGDRELPVLPLVDQPASGVASASANAAPPSAGCRTPI
jgi:hypothetical protein